MSLELQQARIDDSVSRARHLFPREGAAARSSGLYSAAPDSTRIKIAAKVSNNFKSMKPEKKYASWKASSSSSSTGAGGQTKMLTFEEQLLIGNSADGDHISPSRPAGAKDSSALVAKGQSAAEADFEALMPQSLVARKPPPRVPTPAWHAPWELSSVISGHLGWVRSIAFEPRNEWFVTGSADRTIKVWDLAKCCAGADGALKLTLTGHIAAVRGLAVSSRHPYMFSAGEDKKVMCWDLEYNKVIRHYHGHLSGVYCLQLHPTLDVLITGGRDSVARVWDMRTKAQIHMLDGHTGTVGSIITSSVNPQVITGSQDSTIKLWDLAAGKSMTTLTQHKKAVRALVANPRELSFLSGSADNIKKWQTRDGKFIRNFEGHSAIINAMAVNEDGVAVSCADNGSMSFWDYGTGYRFQEAQTIPQPGSLDAEAGVFAAAFDLSGSRLVTCEADKSIKIWRENKQASPESHPVDLAGWTRESLAIKVH